MKNNMTSRERIINAVEFKPTDRLPLDLSGMRSTGISAFAYPKLVEALGLPPRRPRVYDTGQMLALPEPDVLDALGCDCLVMEQGVTNAFPQPELWHDYDFGGRLKAQVRQPEKYEVLPDGTVTLWGGRMVPGSTVFNPEHAGCGIDMYGELQPPDVAKHRENCEAQKLTPETAAEFVEFSRRVRAAAGERAIMAALWPIQSGMGIGMGMWPLQCSLFPEEVYAIHAASAERCVHNMRVLLPLIGGDIDVLMLTADDWGTQTSLVASPDVYRNLFKPHYKTMNAAAHELAPRMKTFMHNCGAVYPLIRDYAESGFDILNPVQWSAGEQTPADWKEAAVGTGGEPKIAFWGGGVNAQHTLPLKGVDDVRDEVRRVVPELSKGGGYVFCNTHNILAEIAPEKVIAMYEEAGRIRPE